MFLSSCKHDYIKIKDKIEGSWKIVEFECYDSEGKIIKKDFVPYTMTFQNPLEEGFVKIDSDKQIEFYYNFSYQVFDGYAKCNIGIKKLIPELPVEMIGRTNVFDYKFLTKKKIEFFNEEEYDLTNQRKLFKVKYIFEKLD